MFGAATTGTHKRSTMTYPISCKSIATREKSCSIVAVQPGGDHGVPGGTILGPLFDHIQADVKPFFRVVT